MTAGQPSHEGSATFSGTISGELVDRARAEAALAPSTQFNVLLALSSAALGAFISGGFALLAGVKNPLPLYLLMAVLFGAGTLAAILCFLDMKKRAGLLKKLEQEGGTLNWSASPGVTSGSATQTGTPADDEGL